MVRWKNKNLVDVSFDDRIPVTDISNQDQDGYTTPKNIIKGATVEYVQDLPSSIWIIQHNLGYFPSIMLVDNNGNEFEAEVEHLDTISTKIKINIAISGKAFLK